ncbi:JASON-like protein [Drosera capensis]
MRSKNCGILWFLWRTVECLLGCLHVRDNKDDDDVDNQRRSMDSARSISRTEGVPVQKNQLSSLLLSDEERVPLVVKDRENPTCGAGWSRSEVVDRELKDEAKFLKACGTIPETPAEIRNLSRKFKDSSPPDARAVPSEVYPRLPSISTCVLLNGDTELDKSSDLTEVHEEGRPEFEEESSPIRTPNTAAFALSSALSVKKSHKQKSVRFQREPVLRKTSPGQNVEKLELAGNQSVRKLSPCPTPLKITDDMQTPGTVFANSLGRLAYRNTGRIRAQYVYTILAPLQKVPHINLLNQEGINLPLASITEMDTASLKENLTPSSEIEAGELSGNSDLKSGFSLDAKLTSPSSFHGCKEYRGAVCLGNGISRSNHGDRPALVMVDTNSEQGEKLPDVSVKGDGVDASLDSTTKYKLDPKVSWHGIPFEEKLDRAMSEETDIICQSYTTTFTKTKETT